MFTRFRPYLEEDGHKEYRYVPVVSLREQEDEAVEEAVDEEHQYHHQYPGWQELV